MKKIIMMSCTFLVVGAAIKGDDQEEPPGAPLRIWLGMG